MKFSSRSSYNLALVRRSPLSLFHFYSITIGTWTSQRSAGDQKTRYHSSLDNCWEPSQDGPDPASCHTERSTQPKSQGLQHSPPNLKFYYFDFAKLPRTCPAVLCEHVLLIACLINRPILRPQLQRPSSTSTPFIPSSRLHKERNPNIGSRSVDRTCLSSLFTSWQRGRATTHSSFTQAQRRKL